MVRPGWPASSRDLLSATRHLSAGWRVAELIRKGSVVAVVARLNAAADGLRRSPVEVVTAASKVSRKELLQQGRRDTGGNLRLSNFRGPALAVEADVRDFGVQAVAELVPSRRSRGTWGLVDSGARPHEIGAAGRRGRRPKLRIGGRWVSGPVRHPGTTGKRTWRTAVGRSLPEARRDARAAFTKAVNGG
jgi:hypothetical protein